MTYWLDKLLLISIASTTTSRHHVGHVSRRIFLRCIPCHCVRRRRQCRWLLHLRRRLVGRRFRGLRHVLFRLIMGCCKILPYWDPPSSYARQGGK